MGSDSQADGGPPSDWDLVSGGPESPRVSLFTKLPTLSPRDVSSVELLMKYHQGIRAEIETRGKNFSTCLELGESLLQRKHQASDEVGWQDGHGFSPVLASTPSGPDSFLGGSLWAMEAHLSFAPGALGLCAGPGIYSLTKPIQGAGCFKGRVGS